MRSWVRTAQMPTLDTSIAARGPAAPVIQPPRRRGWLRQLPQAVRAMRPQQWTKNALVAVAALFAHRATDLPTLARVGLAFLAFSLVASSVYIFNDIADRKRDTLHPTKRSRPIASGQLSVPLAIVVAILSLLLGAALAAGVALLQVSTLASGLADPFLPEGGSIALFLATLGGYMVLNLLYSLTLKHQVLWDVFVIAAGFVLRALAGAFVAIVAISPWFYLCALFLSLLLALGKRRAELATLGDAATRASLRGYSLQLLDHLMTVTVTCALMTYSLYTFQTPTAGHQLMLTIPLVIFGVYRYLYLVYAKGEGETPDTLLLRDKQLLAAVLLCGALAAGLLYGVPAMRGAGLP